MRVAVDEADRSGRLFAGHAGERGNPPRSANATDRLSGTRPRSSSCRFDGNGHHGANGLAPNGPAERGSAAARARRGARVCVCDARILERPGTEASAGDLDRQRIAGTSARMAGIRATFDSSRGGRLRDRRAAAASSAASVPGGRLPACRSRGQRSLATAPSRSRDRRAASVLASTGVASWASPRAGGDRSSSMRSPRAAAGAIELCTCARG